MELTAGATPRQRREMAAAVILDLSRGHTMLSSAIPILEGELDEALFRRYGRPRERRRAQIFGAGIGHAMGRPALRAQIVGPDGSPAPMDPGQRRLLEDRFSAFGELAMLIGPSCKGENVSPVDK
jgi:hypothetical protein